MIFEIFLYWYSIFAYICCVCTFLLIHISHTIFLTLDYKYNILEYIFYDLTISFPLNNIREAGGDYSKDIREEKEEFKTW